jgi:hypothetical protein
MVDIYIDPATGDIDLTNNIMRLTATEPELTRQRIWINLSVNKGSYLFDLNLGVPYFANDYNPISLIGKTSQFMIDAYIKEGILSRPGVDIITSYSSTWDKQSGQSTITYVASAVSGDTVVGEVNIEI